MSQNLYNMKFSASIKPWSQRLSERVEGQNPFTKWPVGWQGMKWVRSLLVWIGTLPTEIFFRQAPSYVPERIAITGKICGIRIEEIEDPLMQEIRRLDKLVDWLAKGKTAQQVLEKYEK